MTGEKAQHQTTCLLVEMTWGTTSPTTVKYSTLPFNFDFPSLGTFIGEKNLEITLPENHSGIEDRAGKIKGPSSMAPFDSLSLGYPHPPVNITIRSYNMDDQVVVDEFTGNLGQGRRSPGGKKGLYESEFVGSKSRVVHLRVSMPANYECANVFAGHVCQVDASAEILTGTITSVSSSSNTVILSSSGLQNEKYARGTLDINGAKYLIKRVTTSGEGVVCYKQPDPSLVGKAFVLRPGCRKRLQDCGFWGNTSRFNGLGIAMPAKNPSFES